MSIRLIVSLCIMTFAGCAATADRRTTDRQASIASIRAALAETARQLSMAQYEQRPLQAWALGLTCCVRRIDLACADPTVRERMLEAAEEWLMCNPSCEDTVIGSLACVQFARIEELRGDFLAADNRYRDVIASLEEKLSAPDGELPPGVRATILRLAADARSRHEALLAKQVIPR